MKEEEKKDPNDIFLDQLKNNMGTRQPHLQNPANVPGQDKVEEKEEDKKEDKIKPVLPPKQQQKGKEVSTASIHVRIAPSEKLKLQLLARNSSIPVSSLVNKLIMTYINDNREALKTLVKDLSK